MTRRTILPSALGLAVAGTFLLGCSAGEKTIDRAEMEENISAQLAEQFPDQPEPIIECPDDLEAEVGATTECELSVDGDEETYPVAVEVTVVEDGKAKFDIEVLEAR